MNNFNINKTFVGATNSVKFQEHRTKKHIILYDLKGGKKHHQHLPRVALVVGDKQMGRLTHRTHLSQQLATQLSRGACAISVEKDGIKLKGPNRRSDCL